MPDLPPQPFDDHSDAYEALKNDGDCLGLCAGCGGWRQNVGIRLGAGAYGMLCFDCWKRVTGGREADLTGQPLQTANPLNI